MVERQIVDLVVAGSIPVDRPIKYTPGGVAQLGEHLICIQKAAGSSPVTSTNNALNY